MPFGKRLRAVRMARGLTQQALSDMVGLALRSYQCYEQGTREPSLSMLVTLADVLRVSTDYLLGRDLENVKSFDVPP
jgi:transcriptional regulator with XRE-family HTH domain